MRYYLILDVGTTNVKAYAFSEEGGIIREESSKVSLSFPRHGWVELDPSELIKKIYGLIDKVISSLGAPTGVGITNQRSSTVIWDKEGTPLYNMITWQDTRTEDLIEEFSSNSLVRLVRILGKGIKGLSKLFPSLREGKRSSYLITLAYVGFGTSHSSLQIKWLMDNVPEVRDAVEKNEAMFGTLDSWIVWNLTGKHVTDYTNASATGLFDSFFLKWSDRILKMLEIPKEILPSVLPNDVKIGKIEGYDFPLLASIADQQASLYRAGVRKGTMKMTHGTGTFIDLNVGEKPKAADTGIYPLIALKTKDRTLYLLEGIVNSSGSAIDWLIEVGIMKDYSEIEEAFEEGSTDLIFIPALAGLFTPYNRPDFKGALLNIVRGTSRKELIRALILGIGMRCCEAIMAIERASGLRVREIVSDGGASKSNELLQIISDLLGKEILRPKELNGSAVGTYMIAKAVHEGRDIISSWKKSKIEAKFEPKRNYEEFKVRWKRALSKLL